jgi:hypothetical protein
MKYTAILLTALTAQNATGLNIEMWGIQDGVPIPESELKLMKLDIAPGLRAGRTGGTIVAAAAAPNPTEYTQNCPSPSICRHIP